MRFMICAFSLVFMVTALGGIPANAEKVRCRSIRDSAMCLAEPTCWYDAANHKGCQEGPRPEEDRCAVHSSEGICNTSSFGCTWNAADSKCVTKAE